MKLIYIAGPYRAATNEGVAHNIDWATLTGQNLIRVTQGGCYPVIPHRNTAHFERVPSLATLADDYWLEGTLLLMTRCDAVLLVYPDADRASKGTAQEVSSAQAMGKPVFRRMEDLEAWLAGMPE